MRAPRTPLSCCGCCAWLVACILLASSADARSPFYQPGDWVSYTNLSFVTSITGDDETVYIGTTKGVARYERHTDRWATPLTVSDGLRDNYVERVFVDPNTNDVWFETPSGYSVLWPSSNTWRQAAVAPELGTEGTSDSFDVGDLFMSYGYMFFPGGYILDPADRRYVVTDYWLDPWGVLWVGTWGLGVGKADVRVRRLEMYPLGLRQDDVSAIAIEEDRLWFGGQEGGGITLYDRKTQAWRHFEAQRIPRLRSDQVRAIVSCDTVVWFGTAYGLAWYDIRRDDWRTYTVFDTLQADEVTALEKHGKWLWIGTVSGVSRLNLLTGAKQIIEEPALRFRYVNDIAAGAGFVWLATDDGVFRYVRATGAWERYHGGEALLAGEVRAVSSAGWQVWFASWLGVVCLDTTTNRLERYPSAIYLQGHQPHCLAAGKEAVWVGCAEGVWEFDQSREDWRHFDASDGLIDNTVQAIALDGDHVWFGTPKGVTRFYWNSPHRMD